MTSVLISRRHRRVAAFATAILFANLLSTMSGATHAQESLARRAVTILESDYTLYNENTPIRGNNELFEQLTLGSPTTLDGLKPALVDTASVVTSLDFDSSAGKIKSMMDLNLRLNGFDGSRLGWGEYTLEANTQGIIQDIININDPGFGFMEVRIGYDGMITHNLDLDPDAASSALVETHSRLRTRTSWEPDAVADLFFTEGDSIRSNDVVNEIIEGFTPKSKENSMIIDSLSEPKLVSLQGEPASFTLSIGWDELARTRIAFVDGQWAESRIEHDFMSTANLELNFYDENMNPIAPLDYTSAQGINYQTAAAVPEPGGVALLTIAASTFCLHRRRRRTPPHG